MNKQRGGTVSTWVAVALLAALASSAAYNIYWIRHHTITIRFSDVASEKPTRPVGIWPRGAWSCGSPGAICYTTI
jgi:hypothetical protein